MGGGTTHGTAMTTSDLMLLAHQTISLEAAERETILWDERKDIANLHVSLKRLQQLDNEKTLQHQRRLEASCESRIRTVERKMTLLDGEEQKQRLAILKSEVLQLEAVVRQCTKSVRGEVFTATQDAQQRIKYFNKTLDIILKKEAAGRRDLVGTERYEFLVLKQRCDKETMDAKREAQISKMRQMKQQQHDQERRRQEEVTASHNSRPTRYSATGTSSMNSTLRKSVASQLESTRRSDNEEMQADSETAIRAEEPRAVEGGAIEADPNTGEGPPQHEVSASEQSPADDRQGRGSPADCSRGSSRASSPATGSRSSSRSTSSRSSSSDDSPHRDNRPPPTNAPHVVEASRRSPVDPPKPASVSKPHPPPNATTMGKRYQHVQARVVVSHGAEFLDARLRDVTKTEDLKRLKIQVDEFEKWDRMFRLLMYMLDGADQRRVTMETHKSGGDSYAQVRCVQRALKRLMEEEQRCRQVVEAGAHAGFDGIVRKVNQQLLHDHQDQRVRLAKLASHQNRVARKLQRLEAERAQLGEVAKESMRVLDMEPVLSPNEADQELAAIGESQPYPAALPPDGALHAAWSAKVSEIELKRRKFIERESMLRRMVLQIYHRQKMKDFGFFDESKMRDDQMKLAASLRAEEAAETMRQLNALDERIATAQLASQQRFKAQQDRDRLLRDEHQARFDIAAECTEGSHALRLEWKALQKQSKGIDFLVDEEAYQRHKLAKDERKRRDILFESFNKFRPVASRKPADPLPVPPPRFEDAVQVYREFFRKNPSTTSSTDRKLSSADVECRTTYFSTAGRKYLPPAKKIVQRTGEGTLMAYHRNKAPVGPTSGEDLRQSKYQKVSAIGGSFYYSSITSATTTINFSAALQAEQSAEMSSSSRRSMSSRKPRPPPRDVCLASVPVQTVIKRRNDKAGARLEPMQPRSPRNPSQSSSARPSRQNSASQQRTPLSAQAPASTHPSDPQTAGRSEVANDPPDNGEPLAEASPASRQHSASLDNETSPAPRADAERDRCTTDASHDAASAKSSSRASSSRSRSSHASSSRGSSQECSRRPSAGTSAEASPARPGNEARETPSEKGSSREVSPTRREDDAQRENGSIDADGAEEAVNLDVEAPVDEQPANAGQQDALDSSQPQARDEDAEPSPMKSAGTDDDYGVDQFEEEEA